MSGAKQTQSKVKKPGPLSLLRSLSVLYLSELPPAGTVGLKRACLLPDSGPCWAQRGLGVESPPAPCCLLPLSLADVSVSEGKTKTNRLMERAWGGSAPRSCCMQRRPPIASIRTAYSAGLPKARSRTRQGHHLPGFHTAPRDCQLSCFFIYKYGSRPSCVSDCPHGLKLKL